MRKTLLSVAGIAAAIAMQYQTANAQLVGSSVFLKGQYVEAGICGDGSFGAGSPPAGYHPHTTSSSGGPLGFVADPAMDGWSTGTPAYTGDYFTPGSPFEGWGIQIGSIRAQAQSCGGYTGSGLTGTNTAYNIVGSKVIGTWEGSFDSMTIRQETTLDTNALYFTMKITLINNASVPKNNIYYMRSVDPDNDQSWGGSFATFNSIDYQLPNPLHATAVSATGITHPSAYLSLGTADTNAKCLTYSSWPISSSVDLSTVYGGTMTGGTYLMGTTMTADIAIGLVFHVAHMAPVDSASDSVAYKTATTRYPKLHPANQASFSYFYAFSPDAVDSALAFLNDTVGWVGDTPTTPTTMIANINEQSVIRAYPNPTRTVINISGLNTTDNIAVVDMMGHYINTNWSIQPSSLNTFSMDMLPVGNYILVVTDAHGNQRSRIPIRKQ